MPAVKKPAKAKTNRYAGLSYFSLLKEANKPIAERSELPIGRNNGMEKMRRFHSPEHELDQMKAAHRDGDIFPNPHNSGWYHYIVEALKELGLDRRHSWDVFYAKVKELMSAVKKVDEDGKTVNLWQRMARKDSRSAKGMDIDGRLKLNCEVLQRVGVRIVDGVARLSGKTPYGFRINQVAQEVLKVPGACIDIEVDGVKNPRKFIKLNLHPTMVTITRPGGQEIKLPLPINQTKRQNVLEPVKRVVKKRKPKVAKSVEVPQTDAVESAEPVVATPEPELVAAE